MNKLETLEICLELWEWLVLNPKLDKSGWPEWEKYGSMIYACPCCEYVGYSYKMTLPDRIERCKECPLTGIAWKDRGDLAFFCLERESPFYRWTHCPDNKEAAMDMVGAIKRAINAESENN